MPGIAATVSAFKTELLAAAMIYENIQQLATSCLSGLMNNSEPEIIVSDLSIGLQFSATSGDLFSLY